MGSLREEGKGFLFNLQLKLIGELPVPTYSRLLSSLPSLTKFVPQVRIIRGLVVLLKTCQLGSYKSQAFSPKTPQSSVLCQEGAGLTVVTRSMWACELGIVGNISTTNTHIWAESGLFPVAIVCGWQSMKGWTEYQGGSLREYTNNIHKSGLHWDQKSSGFPVQDLLRSQQFVRYLLNFLDYLNSNLESVPCC